MTLQKSFYYIKKKIFAFCYLLFAMPSLQKADSQTHFSAINDIAKIILPHKEKDICFLLSAICNAIIAKIIFPVVSSENACSIIYRDSPQAPVGCDGGESNIL